MSDCFSLKVPCGNCPFRNDGDAIALRPGRREEIIKSLLLSQHASFPCHKTVYAGKTQYDDDGKVIIPASAKVCAGAVSVVKKFGFDIPIIQVAERLGAIGENHYEEAHKLTLNKDQLDIDPDSLY